MTDRKQILVVEDEEHLAAGIKYNLEAEGYRVVVAGEAGSALDTIRSNPQDIHLVVLDVMLPGMSGYTMCETLREAGFRMPVLILSARSLAEDKARGFDVGANQYLVKPFNLDELLSRVKNLLALGAHTPSARSEPDASNESPETFGFGDCTLDTRTFVLTRGDESFRLTALQMKLLRYLISNADRIVPRAELLEQVWEMPANMQTRAPDQVIRQLRKICESNPAKPQYLLTVRDAGYLFSPDPDQTSDSSSRTS